MNGYVWYCTDWSISCSIAFTNMRLHEILYSCEQKYECDSHYHKIWYEYVELDDAPANIHVLFYWHEFNYNAIELKSKINHYSHGHLSVFLPYSFLILLWFSLILVREYMFYTHEAIGYTYLSMP